MKTIPAMLTALVLTTVISCKRSEENDAIASEMTTTDSTSVMSSSAAVEKKDSNRKFIRTADLKFRAKNVYQSTTAIENATVKFGGFVTYTNLKSNISDKTETQISQDSILETTKYTVENSITIRVPNTRLDTVIKTIARQIDFLDYRVIKADDVALNMLANEMGKARSEQHQQRLEKAIDAKGKKLSDIANTENELLNQKEQHDNTVIENLSMRDKVNFSTISLELYQRESVKQDVVPNVKSISSYKPHLGLQILDGLQTGWLMLEAIIAFIVQLWALFLLAFLGIVLYKKYRKSPINKG